MPMVLKNIGAIKLLAAYLLSLAALGYISQARDRRGLEWGNICKQRNQVIDLIY